MTATQNPKTIEAAQSPVTASWHLVAKPRNTSYTALSGFRHKPVKFGRMVCEFGHKPLKFGHKPLKFDRMVEASIDNARGKVLSG